MNDRSESQDMPGDVRDKQVMQLEEALGACDSGAEMDVYRREYERLALEHGRLAERLRLSRELVDTRTDTVEELNRELRQVRDNYDRDIAAANDHVHDLTREIEELHKRYNLAREQAQVMAEVADDWRKVAVALAVRVPGPDV